MPLRILHVSELYPGLHQVWGGAEAGCRAFVGATREHCETHVITAPPDHPSPDFPPGHRVLTSLAGRWGALGSFLRRHTVADFVAGSNLRRVIREVSPDLVHVHRFTGLGWGVPRAAVRSGVPTILSLYDCSLFCPRETLVRHDGRPCARMACSYCGVCSTPGNPCNALRNLLWALRARAMRRIAAGAGAVTVLSPVWLDLLADFGIPAEARRVLPLPLSFWPDRAAAEPPGDPGRILFVGWFQPRKGFHVLLDAFVRLAERIPEATLDAVVTGGDPDYDRQIRARVRETGLGERIHIHGRMPPEELRQLLARAAAVAVPEQWPNPQPVVLCEAMAFARNVVASDTGGIPGILGRAGEHGLLAAADDPEEWARNLQEALQARARDPGPRLAARAHAEAHFTQNEVAQRLLALYRRLAGAPERKRPTANVEETD